MGLTQRSISEVKLNDNAYRFIIVSDTHSTLHVKISNLINENTYVIHSGDIGNIDILNNLKSIAKGVFAVNGNNDIHANLPKIYSIATKFGKIIVEHGDVHSSLDYHGSLRASYPGANFIIYGHTHKHVSDMTTIPYIINPGSSASGDTWTNGGSSCAILELSEANGISVEIKKFSAK